MHFQKYVFPQKMHLDLNCYKNLIKNQMQLVCIISSWILKPLSCIQQILKWNFKNDIFTQKFEKCLLFSRPTTAKHKRLVH